MNLHGKLICVAVATPPRAIKNIQRNPHRSDPWLSSASTSLLRPGMYHEQIAVCRLDSDEAIGRFLDKEPS